MRSQAGQKTMLRPFTSLRLALRRNRLSTFRILVLLLLAWPLTLYISLAYLVPSNSPFLIPASLLEARRPLLVTAHPDDESLFFGPTVLGVGEAGNLKEVRILVLSSGNNYGLGSARKSELKEACRRIGAKECLVLDRTDIQDDPKKWWDQDIISRIVQSKVKEWKIDAVLTFDSGGVSGHINHRAVSAAIV
jgi:N-acetylglucosaminylphosphatidylinositol deacetylase